MSTSPLQRLTRGGGGHKRKRGQTGQTHFTGLAVNASVPFSYLPGPPSQPRVVKSLSVSISRIASHSSPPSTTSFVSLVLWRTCMKNSATSSILHTAIASAATTLNSPRSTNATSVVTAVKTSSASSTSV